MSMFINDKS